MLSRVIIFTILTAMLGLTACSTTVYQVKSLEENKELYKGKEISSVKEDGIQTILNFEEQRGEFALFYLHVQNDSEESFVFDPKEVYLTAYPSSIKPEIIAAVDPEATLKNIDADITRENNAHALNTGLNCLGGIFGVVGAVAGGDNAAEKVTGAVEEGVEYAIMSENEDRVHEASVEMLEQSREYWENEVLRKTALEPGQGIGGIVFIYNKPAVFKFTVSVPVKNKEHLYRFEQIAIKK